jgi:phage terminase small subunit
MIKKTDVLNSLKEQLAKKGADIACYLDLIDDYGRFWEVKTALIKDIKKRGVVYEDYSAVGIKMMKNNPSTKELMGANRQMLAILEKLGLTTDKCVSDLDDEL